MSRSNGNEADTTMAAKFRQIVAVCDPEAQVFEWEGRALFAVFGLDFWMTARSIGFLYTGKPKAFGLDGGGLTPGMHTDDGGWPQGKNSK